MGDYTEWKEKGLREDNLDWSMCFDNTQKSCMWSGDTYESDHKQQYIPTEVMDFDERIRRDGCIEDLIGAYG